jgi:drug/metabolite transporter (DMT)-like permease
MISNEILLLFNILCYGVGIFIVYIPNKLYNIPIEKSYVSVSFGRLVGFLIIGFFSAKRINIKEKLTKENIYPNIFTFMSLTVSTTGYILYDVLISRNVDISIVSAVTNLYIIIPALYGIIVLKDKMNTYRYIGFTLVLVSIILMGFNKKITEKIFPDNNSNATTTVIYSKNTISDWKDVILTLLVMCCWGFSSVIRIYSLKRIEYSHFIYMSIFGQTFNLLLMVIHHIISKTTLTEWSLVIVSGHIIISIGTVCNVIIASSSETSKWVALSQLSVIITITLGITFFGDKIGPVLITSFLLLILSSLAISKKTIAN